MKIIGHRGARGLAPENTLVALRKGVEHAADMLEFDVRVTKDRVAVLHHDRHLTDPDGTHYVIAQHSLTTLRAHKADLATLEEALVAVGKSIDLYIEVKSGENVKPIVSTIISHVSRARQAQHLYLASFSQETLRQLHGALPHVQKIVIERWSGVQASRRARQLSTKHISMNQRWLWRGFIKVMTRRGYQLYAYTLNDAAKARRWTKAGLSGVITDYPDRFEG